MLGFIFKLYKKENHNKKDYKIGDRTYYSFLNAPMTTIEKYLKEHNLTEYLYLVGSRYTLAEKMKQKAIDNNREYVIY